MSTHTSCTQKFADQLPYVHSYYLHRVIELIIQQPEIRQEFEDMREQVLYEQRHEVKSFKQAWARYRKRVFVAIVVQGMTSLTGTNVIAYCKFVPYATRDGV